MSLQLSSVLEGILEGEAGLLLSFVDALGAVDVILAVRAVHAAYLTNLSIEHKTQAPLEDAGRRSNARGQQRLFRKGENMIKRIRLAGTTGCSAIERPRTWWRF